MQRLKKSGMAVWVWKKASNEDDVFSSKAPDQTAPGTKTLEGQHINDQGRVGPPWEAHYDEYGRQIGRTEYMREINRKIYPIPTTIRENTTPNFLKVGTQEITCQECMFHDFGTQKINDFIALKPRYFDLLKSINLTRNISQDMTLK